MVLARDEAKLREDFDQIADLDVGDGWDHNSHYHGYLLRQLPGHIGEALDVGCGAGSFARLLARLSERVVAIDLSPRMVEVARSRSGRYPNVSYAVANANTWPFPEDRFDCVASITTLHHLPLAPILRKMSGALKPGGTLLVLDIYRAQNLADYLTDVAGFVASKAISLAEGSARPLRQTPALQLAWAEHGKWDVYPGPAEVRAACADAGLREARVRRHLLWRYSVVWRKPRKRNRCWTRSRRRTAPYRLPDATGWPLVGVTHLEACPAGCRGLY